MPERMSCIGEDERRMSAFGRGHVLAPRLGDADDELQGRIDLPGGLGQAVGQAEQLVLGKRQYGGGIAGGGQLPAADAVAVAADGRLDEFTHEAGDVRHVAFPQPQPGRQVRRREVDERPRHGRQSVGLRPLQQGVVRLPVVGCLLPLDEVPRQRDVNRVERPLEQGGRLGGRRRRAETAAERRFQARLPLSANVEHLFGVGVDQTLGRAIGEFQRGMRLAVGVGRGRLGDGLAERRRGLSDFPLQVGGELKAAHLPVGRLAAELVDLAAGQLDEELVGVRPFHQGGRGAHEEAGAWDRPGGDKIAAFVRAPKRKQLRQEKAKPIVGKIKQQLDKINAPPQSTLGEAVRYALNQWEYLERYADYGEVEISNCWVENLIRPFALGRRNWLFVGNEESAAKSALLYSLIQTCILNRIDPYDYLVYVLNQAHKMRRGEVDPVTLLPQFIDKSLLK